MSIQETDVINEAVGSSYTHIPDEYLGFAYDSDNENNLLTVTVLDDDTSTIEVYYTRNLVTVNYETNANVSISSSQALYGSDLTSPEDPIRTGYEFVNWYSDENLTQEFSFETYPAQDITIYAKWQGVPSTISFDSNGGDSLSDLVQNTGTQVTLPTPVRTGYSFIGWFESALLQTEFQSSLMPAGTTTIYAKWEPLNYTITYNSLGGSVVEATNHDFGESIVLAADPTKTDNLFGGWFLDETLNTPFNYLTMPASDLTLYAKWIDASDPYSILVNTTKESGSLVTLRGVVYAKHNSSYLGYYLSDDTAYVYIEGSNASVNIGEELEITGMLLFDSFNEPYIQGPTFTVLNTNQTTRSSKELLFSEYETLAEYNALYVSEIFTTEAIIFEDNGNYFLIDPASLIQIPISLKSLVEEVEILASINKNYVADYILTYEAGVYKAALIDLVAESLTATEKLTIVQNIILNQLLKSTYLEGEAFELPTTDIFGFAEIDYSSSVNQEFYDSVNQKFLDVSEDEIITFSVTLTATTLEVLNFDFTVTVKPIHITSIADMIDGIEGEYYQIQGVVVSRGEGNIMILKDDSGFVFIQDPFFLEIGDEVILNVKKQTDGNMVLLTSENDGLYFTAYVDTEVELNLIPQVISVSDILAMDYTDPNIYAKYYEVRGYLLPELGDYHTTHNLVVGENMVPISSYTYQGFENLMDYEYLEIIIRVYLVEGVEGPMLYYEGIRQDIRIPEYTDQELVDTIYQIFLYSFADREFEAFEEFYLYPYHPQLGGTITWTLDSATEAVYDYNRQQFLYDYVDTTVEFTVVISKGSASRTITYQSILHKIEPVSFDYFYSLDKTYGTYYLKGTVIYWHPYFSYIMDDLGNIIIIEEDLEGVKKGDLVLLHAEISYQYDNSIFFRIAYGEDSPLVEIISRENPVNISLTSMDISTLSGLDFSDPSVYHQLIEIEGKLVKLDYYNLAIETAYGLVYIDHVDGHTYFNLAQFTDQYVSLKGFIYTYDDEYKSITLRYIGGEGGVSALSYTELEKIAIIKAFILSEYQKPMIGDNLFDFFQVESIFDEGTFTFTPVGDTGNILDINGGYINEVLATFEIDVNVTIDINGVTDSFTITMTINPEVPMGTIADMKANVNKTYISGGQVIAITRTGSSTYCLMVEGDGGVIFLFLTHEQYYDYYDYNGYVGEYIEFMGAAKHIKGKYEVIAESFSVLSRSGTVEAIFTEIDIADLLALNLYDEAIYGVPYQITGLVEREYGDNAELYYINDGINRILITTNELYFGVLNNYVGYDVTVKAFVYGENPAFGTEEITLIVNKYKYDGEDSIKLANLSDQEVVDILLERVIESYQENYMSLNPGDTGSYISGISEPIRSSYPDATIVATVKSGLDYIDFYGGYFIAKSVSEDQIVEILITIECNTASATTVLEFKINGYTINNFLDLFSTDLGTEEIVLEAEMVLSAWGYHYFKIGDEIYYLETKAYLNAYPGQSVLLIGKKNIIDGIPDYTYDIAVVGLDDYPYTTLVPSSSVTIADLYANDYDLNPIHRDYLEVYGVLGYDPYLELYTLTDDDKTIYVRYSDYYSYEDYLEMYIGYPIVLDIFLPMEYIMNEYMLVDTFGTTSDFELATLDETQSFDFSQNYLENYFNNLQIKSGESIDVFPFYLNYTLASYTYALVNSSDESWIDLEYYTTNITETLRTIELEVLIEIDGYENSRTVYVNFDLIPNETLTVKEALYAPFDQLVQVQGVITYINEEYYYMIISGDNYNYLISIDNSIYSLFDMTNVNFVVGNEIVIAGYTNYFAQSEYIVYMENIKAVKTINTAVSYTLTPEVMSFDDLMNMDYLDPMNFFKYVIVEEELTWNLSSMYPSYQITDYDRYVEEYGEYFDIEIIPNIDAQTFHTAINPYEGNNVRLEGFIYLESMYVDFYFSIGITDYEVIAD